MVKKSEMEIIKLNINEIIPYPDNPRKNDNAVNAVAESIKQCGYCSPIVIDEGNVILAGHTRLKALKKLKWKEVECVRKTGLTEEQKKKYRILDNKTNELAEWDFDLLEEEIDGLDFDGFDFGFDFNSDEDDAEIIEDEVPEVNEEIEPTVKLGDIWQLGEHRLMCGDSTDKATVELLMDGKKADMVFTDPPYNMAFNGRSGKFDVIENDDLSEEDFNNFIEETCQMIKHLDPDCYYVWCNWEFYGVLQSKLPFKSCIVWAKNVFGLGRGYRHQHEFCLFNGTIDDKITNESDLWEIAKDSNYVHPTQKPVALCARALKNHIDVENVVDLFGGSGSTLMACEQLNRKCYMMELDPKYCDVIIKRWETFTGKKAVKIN